MKLTCYRPVTAFPVCGKKVPLQFGPSAGQVTRQTLVNGTNSRAGRGRVKDSATPCLTQPSPTTQSFIYCTLPFATTETHQEHKETGSSRASPIVSVACRFHFNPTVSIDGARP
jgi:hypothetical protein